jgi:hypothetical protein
MQNILYFIKAWEPGYLSQYIDYTKGKHDLIPGRNEKFFSLPKFQELFCGPSSLL